MRGRVRVGELAAARAWFRSVRRRLVTDDLYADMFQTLLACDDLLTEHVEGPRDLAEHARRLRNLQVHVSDLVRRLGLRGDR